MFHSLLALALVLAQPAVEPRAPAPLIGIVATRPAATDSDGYQFARAALDAAASFPRLAVEVADDHGSDEGVREAVTRLIQAGAVAIVGPLDGGLVEVAAKTAAARRVPLVAPVPPTERAAEAVRETVVQRLRARRVALLSDQSRAARDLEKALVRLLPHPYAVVFHAGIDVSAKELEKLLARDPATVVLVDAPAELVRAALEGPLGPLPLPIVLTPRSHGDLLRGTDREVFAILGRSPATMGGGSPLLTEHRRRHGEPGYGAAEGDEAVRLVAAALQGAGGDAAAALAAARVAGPRGTIGLDAASLRLDAPQALWRLAAGVPRPYLPAAIPAELLEAGTAGLRDVDPELGVPFGTCRTDRFTLEEKTQWVVFSFGAPEESTIDQDLASIGLSSGGRAPLVDHLVKEEILARLMAINSTKFLRTDAGESIPGRSLRISFADHLPHKAKGGKAWTAVIAGDDAAAGGRAWPGQGHCEIYSTFIRRTIYQEHALDPPVGPDDLTYLDGSYRFGTDRARDRRSELIRALINGYAGSMALTAAHEIGHLAGLDHITDDPHGIMNVEEGAGIDHRDGHFTDGSLEKLRQRFGVAK